jgi:NAD(P)-dependent dehydrogenase (short-subunit alcohol dehydrogenase family)
VELEVIGVGETSIPCTESTRDRLRDDKTTGVSWDRYLNDLLDAAERVDDYENGADVTDLSSLADAVETVETRTGKIERMLEEVANR